MLFEALTSAKLQMEFGMERGPSYLQMVLLYTLALGKMESAKDM